MGSVKNFPSAIAHACGSRSMMRHGTAVFDASRIRRIALDVGQFGCGELRVILRPVIESEPTGDPDKSQGAGGNECHAPSIAIE